MPRLTALVVSALLATSSLVATASVAAADTSVTKTPLHFAVTVGPNQQACDIVGDLYLPASASAATPVPAILTTNGFGGSKDDQAGFGQAYAARGYAVLSYSGLGFGGSSCQITLDDPAYDGAAGSRLVSYLGGAPGVAFADAAHTQPVAPLTAVVHDAVAHDGKAYQYDPRVGMIGGSYGGEIQFAIAGIDPRVDTIIPMITWNNLNYSLAPNNANPAGTKVTSSVPGAVKFFWATGFSAVGVEDGIQGAQSDPSRLVPCPNFAAWVCPGLAYGAATGTLDATTAANLQHASVANYVSNIRIPTLLAQGEFDTLFNLNEATATFEALQAQGTPVRMIWHSWGHSHSNPAPGEFSLNSPNFGNEYETDRVASWFDHYLKGANTDLGPKFAYFRDWISYTGDASAAYQSTGNFPLPSARYYLGNGDLATGAASGSATQTFLTAPAGLPTSISPIDAIGSALPPQPENDLQGTFAKWDTAPLGTDVAVVGSPVVNLSVKASATNLLGGLSPLTDLVLFVRLQDVAPDGTATDIRQLTAPIRVNPNQPFSIRMPAIVHDFAAGHLLRLIVAGGSINYRGGTTGAVVQISGGGGQTLDLPVGH